MLAALRASYMTISITIQHHEMNIFSLSSTPELLSSFRAYDRQCFFQLNSGPGGSLRACRIGSAASSFERFVIDL
jgi:hypothetical protein